ncbi:low specificity L-threonine aldolase [Gordonia humi]|uniref:Threonine aldolase n=1 Tax=Gordonia humi TaxID=686429 RepID=A0A840EXM1_9ACTN|nr:threonine aldolase [Gordonia humi]
MTADSTAPQTDFASDNYAGTHPEVMSALAEANRGRAVAYGDDPVTARLATTITEHFGEQARAYPVFTGTAANVLSLQALLPRWGAVVTAATAHIVTDEGGAPEHVAGLKLLPVDAPDGRIGPELIDAAAADLGDRQRAQPAAVSITQATELGTVYSAAQIRAVSDAAHAHGMRVHMDGSRLANAAAHLNLPLRALTVDVGVDVLSLGGTKNGAMGAEAVVVLNPDAVSGVEYLRKSSAQLASKMRFLSAQLVALYDGDLWLRNAAHANAMATRFRTLIEASDSPIEVTRPTQANAVFAALPAGVADALRTRFRFYDWNPATGEVRWMFAFDTTEADVDEFAAAVVGALPR